MKTTSHFIGIELKQEIFVDLFVKIYEYLRKNNIENIVNFQNPLSLHITLYYLEKYLEDNLKNEIKKEIEKIDVNKKIELSGFNYFFRGKGNRFVLYLETKTDLELEKCRNKLHEKYNRDFVEDNNYKFSPHITFLRIQDSKIFENHRENIEIIIKQELEKLKNIDINNKKIYLYTVNSKFKEEIQIKI